MKTSLPLEKILYLFVPLIFETGIAAAQFSEMNFQNPTLESGTYGDDGSKYRFSNISSTLDAVITIIGRSGPSVVVSNMDTTGSIGYDKAFQPVLGIPGTAPANSTWWVDFSMTFYQIGTMVPVMPMQFYATGLDIDGDGASISEWAEMYKIEKIDSAQINSLTFKQLSPYFQGYDYRIEGIVVNSPGIDTSAKNVMAKYKYSNKQTINFRIGATTNSSTSSAAMRLNSIWFQDLYLGAVLSAKLLSFSATEENNVVELNWTTATEEDLKKFVIERSYDNRNFSEVNAVLPHGHPNDKNNYTFFDRLTENSPGTIYYRLHSIAINGKSEYSDIRIITRQRASELNISAYPNPVMNDLLVTMPSTWQKKKVTFELFSVNGQAVKKFKTTNTGQTELLNVNNVAPGAYFLKASCDGKIVQGKIIKN